LKSWRFLQSDMSRSQPISVAKHELDASRLTSQNRSAYSAIEIPMDAEIAGLEQKLATLLADYHRLRAENESLKRELGRSLEQNRTLNSRIAVMAGLNIAHELLRSKSGNGSAAAAASFDTSAIQRRISAMQLAIDRAMAEQDKLF